MRWIDDWRAAPPRGVAHRPAWRLALASGMAAGLYTMVGLLVPLWAAALGASPQQVGLLVGAGAVLPMLLAVPAGASVARLGAPRLLVVAALLAMVGTLAIPFERDLTRLLLLQLVGGLGRAIAWMAVQTYLVQLGGGPDGARRAVVFSCASMLGTLLSPFVVGFLVEGGGHGAAFGTATAAYALLALVGARLPASDPQARLEAHPAPPASAPRLASRGMALVLLGTFLRFACGSLRLAFFPLYLAGLGYSPLAIGLLVGLGNLVSVGGVPLARPLLARLGSPRLLFVALCVGLTALALTPLGTGVLPLVGLAALWGLGMGLSLPALLQQIADGTRREDRGLAIGLRQTVNEAAALTTPVALGLASARIGIEGGFYMVGGGLALLALGGLVCATGPTLRRVWRGGRPQHQLPEVLAAERLR